jgi:putative DNA primase/helicase
MSGAVSGAAALDRLDPEWSDEAYYDSLLGDVYADTPPADELAERRWLKEQEARRQAAEDAMADEGLTDLGNARRFARLFGADLRWVPEWNRWLRWLGTHWAPTAEDDVRQLTYRLSDHLREVACGTDDPVRRGALERHARTTESSRSINATVREAKTLLSCPAARFDRDGYLYNIRNGTLDLRATCLDEVFRPHRREDYITKLVPVRWTHHATAPRFERFLADVFPDDSDTAEYILKIMATCLVGDLVEQSYYLWWGRRGRNGKGVLQRILDALIGPYAVSVDPKVFFATTRHDANAANSAVMSLRDARLVSGSELSRDDVLGGPLLKRYTGGDPISGRDLHERARETPPFVPTGTVLMSTNHFPRAEPDDDALWARTRIVEFPVHFGGPGGPPIDATLEADLHTELEGILVRLVQSWIAIQQTDRTQVTLEQGLLGAPEAVRRTTAMVRSSFSPIGGFVQECCITGESEREVPRDLYRAYKQWARQSEIAPEAVLSETAFGRQLTTMKFARRESNGRGWRMGLRLKTPPQP